MRRAQAGGIPDQGEAPAAQGMPVPVGTAAGHVAAALQALRWEGVGHRVSAANPPESWYRVDHNALARAATYHAATLRRLARRQHVWPTDCDALKAGEDALERQAARHWLAATGSLDPDQQDVFFASSAEAEAHACAVRTLRLAVEGGGAER